MEEFFKSFTSLLSILNESIKLLPKNGKLMAFIALYSLALSSTIFVLFNYSMEFVINDNANKIMKKLMSDLTSFNTADPNNITPETAAFLAYKISRIVREYSALIFAVQIPFLFVLFIIFFFSSISTILVSSMSYSSKKSSLNEVFSIILSIWKGPMVTVLYVLGLATGYALFVFTWAAPLLLYPSIITYCLATLVVVFALCLYSYLFVSWAMAIVVSVLEEGCFGLEALGRGEKLVSGKKLDGFLINVGFNVVCLIVFWGCNKMVFVVGVSCLGKILTDVAYTVLYLRCRVENGEEIELRRGVDYSKLPTAQSGNEMA
ncbi:hypothetical protein ABFS83_11G026000 [Erythranthe nasuta]